MYRTHGLYDSISVHLTLATYRLFLRIRWSYWVKQTAESSNLTTFNQTTSTAISPIYPIYYWWLEDHYKHLALQRKWESEITDEVLFGPHSEEESWVASNLSGYLIWIQNESREGAVLVVVAPMGLAPVQFDVDLVSRLQMQHGTVTGIIIVLVSVLGYGTGSNLEGWRHVYIVSSCI